MRDLNPIHLSSGLLDVTMSLHGGSILRATWQSVPILRTGAPGCSPGDSGCFPLLPFGNRVTGNRFSFEGKDYALRPNTAEDPHYLHGEGWLSTWGLVKQTPHSVEMRHTHDGSAVPYVYEAQQTVSIYRGVLTVSLKVTNTGVHKMPFGIGFHPFFPLTPDTHLQFTAGRMRDELPGFLSGGPVPRPQDLEFGVPSPIPRRWVNNAFEDWDGKARIDWPEQGISVGIDADPLFQFVQIYTPGPDGRGESTTDFFAFEPMSHLPNGHNMDNLGWLKPLAPSQSISGSIKLEPVALFHDEPSNEE